MHLLNLDETLEKIAALEAASDLGKILSHKWHDHIAGGLAEHRSPADFPREDLLKGMVVEMEHTSDPSVACEIAMDHLMEDQHYYNHEQDMAKEVREKLGHVVLREDAVIKIAQIMGAKLAEINKEALNPLSAIKSVGTKMLGNVAPKAVGAVAHGAEGALAHGAEGAMGKVLPFHGATPHVGTLGGHAGISGLERTVSHQPSIVGAVEKATGQPIQRTPTAQFNAKKEQFMQESAGGRVGADQLLKDPKLLSEHHRAISTGQPSAGRVVNKTQFDPTANRTVPAVNQSMSKMVGTPASPAVSPGSVASPIAQAEGVRVKNLAPGWSSPNASSVGQVTANPAGRVVSKPASGLGNSVPKELALEEPPPAGWSKLPEETKPGGWAGKLDQEMGPMPTNKPGYTTPGAEREKARLAKQQAPAAGPQSGGSLGGNAGFANSPGAVVPNGTGGMAGGPPAAPPGSVTPNSGATGPQQKRFGWGKAMLGAGVLGGGYAAYKGIPWAANKIDDNLSDPKMYGGGFRATPYGYGPNPYGDGMPSMGAG